MPYSFTEHGAVWGIGGLDDWLIEGLKDWRNGGLEFGICLLFGAWYLELVWYLVFGFCNFTPTAPNWGSVITKAITWWEPEQKFAVGITSLLLRQLAERPGGGWKFRYQRRSGSSKKASTGVEAFFIWRLGDLRCFVHVGELFPVGWTDCSQGRQSFPTNLLRIIFCRPGPIIQIHQLNQNLSGW